jgi:predicted ATPase/DNA-binding winged helix-turn-helix (wHTH) protein
MALTNFWNLRLECYRSSRLPAPLPQDANDKVVVKSYARSKNEAMLDKSIDVAFAFGPFRLIPSQHVLLRDNRPVKLGGRALDILHLLVMRAGEEVSKNALIEWAWPNVIVDERNLKVHIRSLRRALDDTFPQATYIATVVGHGYQFVGSVQTAPVKIADFSRDQQSAVSNLPAPATLIGRQRDVEGVARALDVTRLVTLVGPGGVGKTSLAIAVAYARHGDFPDGVCFVDLSATDHPPLVPHLVATALGVRGDPSDLISAVVEHLRERSILLVLDNCEHLLHAVTAVAARFVEAKISSCLLATSREPLGVSGENVQRVEPLAFPPRAEVRSVSEALAYPSIALFALRALETADYRLTDEDTYAVASLCEALDGLPLAIEIAAAKLDHFSSAELLNSVSTRLKELRNEDDGTHSRHRTIWAMLDWSYQLLSTQESTIFRLLSVFAGSFEWTDVTGIARLVQYDPYQTTVALGGLVSKSLLSAEIDGEQLRYRLLESTRRYAAEKLLQDHLAQDAQHQHAQIVLSVFEKSESEWAWVDNRVWRARYEARIGDLRKVLDWCFSAGGDARIGVDLVVSVTRLWTEQSSIGEQRFQVERALNHCKQMTDAPQRTAALATSWAWSMTLARRLQEETDEAWRAALNFARRSGDVGQHLSAMYGHAFFLIWKGRNEQALLLLDEFQQIAAQAGDRASLFDGERARAFVEMHLGNLLDARTKLEKLAEELAHGVPPSRVVRYQLQRHVSIHSTLAFSTWVTGRPERALAMTEEMVLMTGKSGQLIGQSHILALVAMPLAFWSGKADALERYSSMLRGNLDRENIALWEPVHQFYASVSRHARGSLNAVGEMRSAIDELVRDGFLAHTPMYLGGCAEALVSRGKYQDADEAVEFAFTLLRQSKENWCLPELLRVKAQIMAALGERGRASAMLARARENAIKIGARSLELRIVNDMAQMAIAEGNNEEAVELLVPVYKSFGDGTATEDLERSARLLTAAGANGLRCPRGDEEIIATYRANGLIP